MKSVSKLFQSLSTNYKSKIEPCILWSLKDYPLTFIPFILQTQGDFSNSFERKLKRLGCREITYFPIINGYSLSAPVSRIKDILNIPILTYISINHKVFAFMNHISSNLGAYQVNQYGITGRNITIAHLDTGIYPHGDLIRPKNRILFFKDFVDEYSSPYDDNGHGTHCAGCMAGNGVLSKGQYKGIAPDALLVGLKCLDEKGTGDVKNTLKALQWVLDNREQYHIRIVHIPFGVYHPYPFKKDPLIKAVEKLWQEGLVVICAAGNNGPYKASIASPGSSESVITVGSCLKNAYENMPQAVCDFSSRGPTFAGENKPDLVVPGKNITSLYCDPQYHPSMRKKDVLSTPYLSFTGTSVSSSIVAGAVALLLEKCPEFSPDEVKLALEMSCKSLHLGKNVQGKGVLDIESLLTSEFQ